MDHITNFYKNLFGHPEVSSISLNIDNPKTVSANAGNKLVAEFSLEEIKNVVFKMAHNKSPAPDGFTAEFYQHFSELVKHDLKALFDDFHKGVLDIRRLSPKSKDANQIQKYRPTICLMNVC